MKYITTSAAFIVIAVVGCLPVSHITNAATPPLTKNDVEQIVHNEIARTQNNVDFDPDSSTFQPYYVPFTANSDGTMLTVSRINATVGDFASGINISDTDTGETYCLTVSSGTVVANEGSC